MNIEDAIKNQARLLLVEESSARDRTPLYLDRAVFHGIFGVVTWYACQRVQEHYDKTEKPYKPCTGVFTRVTGLPCAHKYDERRAMSFIPTDFDQHWYWDRVSPHQPYLDPVTIAPFHHRQETAGNTGRILSGFETVERIDSPHAPPTCSACGALGHTRSQRQCPLKLRSSIANDIVQLQEQERSLPITPQANKQIRIEVPDSSQSSVTEFFSPLSTLSF